MTEERVKRRLAAVLAADAVGYSRLMGADEEGTLARLKAVRKTVIDPALASHRGRIVKTTGDGLLVEFGSAVDAARCSVEVQRAIEALNADIPRDTRIEFRIGIHVGDIIIDDNDIFGDGVNIAARLEGLAEPGGICLSDDAYRQIRGKADIACDDLGPQTLKNIVEPMRAWRVELAQGAAKTQLRLPAGQPPALALPDKPSIAVLPFQNMSGDPEQEYFADGVVEDIITALSRFKSLFVIARNSSFTFKSKTVDLKEVGRNLGVRYVLEGSVRKAAGKVRMTAQLIDTSSGAHIWADRLDGELTDIFALQDQITEKVAAVIEPNIKRAEIEAAQRQLPVNFQAYDLYLRALPRYYSLTEPGSVDALQLCYRALDINSRQIAAVRLAAQLLAMRVAQGWSTNAKSDYTETVRLCRLALDIDDTDSDTLALWGRGLGFITNDYESAKEMVDRAVTLNTNSAYAWTGRGWTYRYMRNTQEALKSFERAMRLNPLDPMLFDTLTGVGSTLIIAGRDEEAAAQARKALALNPRYTSAHRVLAAALAYLGREAEAKEAAAALMAIEPSFSISKWASYGGQWQGQRFLEGLRLAGLSD